MRTSTIAAVFLVIALSLTVENASSLGSSCGYKSCPKVRSDLINIHLVPHSHDDVGWLKTVDQYYYGNRNNIQRAGVQYIIDNIVQQLLLDPARRFIQVESAFFEKWYNEQSSKMKKNVQSLVKSGRLEFAGGAWSMNDEAAVHYQSVIDQFSLGLKFLNDQFGSCGRPRVGWQIDPFGHSREMASIFAQLGYDAEFFARMDWVDKGERVNNKSLEMIWSASDNLGSSAEIFTGMLYNHYSAPGGFCFDTLCSDEPIIDGDSYDNNVNARVDGFIAHCEKMSKIYRGTNLMVPMGDDFHYENAGMNYKNMDKLIKYVNERQLVGSKYNVFYSTPSCYLKALHESKLTWPTKTEDFFPYSSDWHSYWTGYFSSRPTQKRFERDGNHFLQVTKQLTTLANLTDDNANANLDKLRKIMGVMQHHDAITGTEKQHVSDDYDRMLTAGLEAAQHNARSALQKLTNLTSGDFHSCPQLNISICEPTSKDSYVVTVYNPLAHVSTQLIRLPAKSAKYSVRDESGFEVQYQIVQLPETVQQLEYRPLSTKLELVFPATVDKVASFYVQALPSERTESKHRVIPERFQNLVQQKPTPVQQERATEDLVVQNSLVKLIFSGATGHLVNVEMNGVSQKILQNFHYYEGAAGNNYEFKNRSSGAYIFRPNGTDAKMGETVTNTVYKGDLVTEVHQVFNDWVSQVIRISPEQNYVEFEWLVGPIPVEDGLGKEIVTRFTTDLDTKGAFWTDTNGREMLRRVKNHREGYSPNVTENVSSNYYPITARIAIEDARTRLALLNDRAQGGSSVRSGEVELMVHRRLLRDDAFGVGEALNEQKYGKGLIARGKVYLILNAISKNPTYDERLAQQQIHLPFWKFFSSPYQASDKTPPQIPSFKTLPQSVNVLTLEPYSSNERLLRLEHFMDQSESTEQIFNIRSIFDSLNGSEIRETTLDGSMPLKDMKRTKFHADGETSVKVDYLTATHTPLAAKKKDNDSKFIITMKPMQIRTFIIKW